MKKREAELCERIYRSFRRKVWGFLWKYFPGIRGQDALDVMQEVWAALGKNVGSVKKKSDSEILSWLFTVTRNAAVDWIRKNSRKYQWETGEKEWLEWFAAKSYLPEDILDKIMAEEILKELSQEDLLFLEDEFMSRKEKRKQTNAETCRIYRIRKRLEEKMESREL